jgi:hypothetical protein
LPLSAVNQGPNAESVIRVGIRTHTQTKFILREIIAVFVSYESTV